VTAVRNWGRRTDHEVQGRRRRSKLVGAASPDWQNRGVSVQINAPPHPEAGTVKDNQLQKLLKKTQAKADQKASKPKPSFDHTLEATKKPGVEDVDGEAAEIFKEMKKREF